MKKRNPFQYNKFLGYSKYFTNIIKVLTGLIVEKNITGDKSFLYYEYKYLMTVHISNYLSNVCHFLRLMALVVLVDIHIVYLEKTLRK